MKKLAVPAIFALTAATNVLAADLPRRALPPVVTPLPVFTWTGFYAGINAGYGWSDSKAHTQSIDALGWPSNEVLGNLGLARAKYNKGGFSGGGQIGYNHQFTPGSGVVLGIEADAQYMDVSRRRKGSVINSSVILDQTLTDTLTANSKHSQEYLGTVRGRLGYAFDRVLVYGTGGFAYGDVSYRAGITDTFSVSDGGVTVLSGTDRYAGRASGTRTGYVYGGGIEYALPVDSFLNVFRSSAVTMRAEYLHYDLGKQSILTYDVNAPTTAVAVTKIRNEGDLVRAGLNFKFGGL